MRRTANVRVGELAGYKYVWFWFWFATTGYDPKTLLEIV